MDCGKVGIKKGYIPQGLKTDKNELVESKLDNMEIVKPT